MKKLKVLALAGFVVLVGSTLAINSVAISTEDIGDNVANARGNVPLHEEPEAPRLGKVDNSDIKKKRAYPMQPPVVPHKTDNYQIDLRVNKCMSCHSRKRTEDSQAPMVSVTHYMDRDGNFLASVSPRRYFCQQCHVTQTDAKPLVGNHFMDVDALMNNKK